MEFDVQKEHTLEEYRDYYAGIPEENWCVCSFYGEDKKSRCAIGHLMKPSVYITHPDRLSAAEGQLDTIFGLTNIYRINDGKNPRYQQSTPKQRILAAIEDKIKERDAGKPKIEVNVKFEEKQLVTK